MILSTSHLMEKLVKLPQNADGPVINASHLRKHIIDLFMIRISSLGVLAPNHLAMVSHLDEEVVEDLEEVEEAEAVVEGIMPGAQHTVVSNKMQPHQLGLEVGTAGARQMTSVTVTQMIVWMNRLRRHPTLRVRCLQSQCPVSRHSMKILDWIKRGYL